MVQVNLKTSIVIEPSKLVGDIELILLNMVKKSVINTCDKANGYIIDVLSISDYDNFISNATSQVVFIVVYLAECIKPSIGDKVNAKVVNITADGIFCVVYDRSTTLISTNKIDKTIYNPFNKGIIEHKTDKSKNITVGSNIMVEITNTRYDNKDFSCIAVLV